MISRSVVAMVAILSIQGYSAIMAQDHLEPEAGVLSFGEDWDYKKRLRDVLLKDAATSHLARMLCLPSYDTEWMVTVVREPGGYIGAHMKNYPLAPVYFVEYAVAEPKIYRAKDIQDLKVKKSQAPLDPDTAELLNKTWRRMLLRTHYPERKRDRLGPAWVTYHFSRSVPAFDGRKKDPLAGWEQGTIWNPIDDTLCGELIAIGKGLRDYALAHPHDRPNLVPVIRDKTNQLAVKLDGPARDE